MKPMTGRSHCPYCEPILEELRLVCSRCDVLERMVRVDSAIARRLSEALIENGRLRKRIADLENN